MMPHPRYAYLSELLRDDASADMRRRSHTRRRATARHVASCPRCRDTLDWMRSTREAATDAPQRSANADHTWTHIARRVRDGEGVLLPVGHATRAPKRRRTAWRVALLLLFAAGTAAAMPGSPVVEWLRARVGVRSPASATPTPAANAAATLLLEAEDGQLLVRVTNAAQDVRVHVRITNDTTLAVRATGAAAAATFRAAPGRIDIIDARGGTVHLDVPGTAAATTLEVDGETWLVHTRDGTRVLAPGADTVGAEFILPVRPRE